MTGSREALIIATGTYEDPELRRLRAPAQDAEALTRVLADPAIGGFQVESVVDQPARVITRAAQQFFAGRGLDDLLLVHLSCHGVKDDDGRLYFAALDTEKKFLASTGVSAALMVDLMEHCRARSIVLLLDCCYSGAFVAGAKGDEGVHLKEKFEGEGRAILTASNAIEYSWEGDDLTGEGAPSVFTAAIVEGLETGAADRDRDGRVSIEDLYGHVYERVRSAHPGQTPKKWEFGVEHDLYVARNPHPIEIQAAALPPELQAALESPLPSVRSGIVEDLGRLLLSSNAGMAKAAQQALEQLRADDSRRVSAAAIAVLGAQPTVHAVAEQRPRAAQEEKAWEAQEEKTQEEQAQTARDEQEQTARDEQEQTARDEQEQTARDEQEQTARDEQEQTARDEQEQTARDDQGQAHPKPLLRRPLTGVVLATLAILAIVGAAVIFDADDGGRSTDPSSSSSLPSIPPQGVAPLSAEEVALIDYLNTGFLGETSAVTRCKSDQAAMNEAIDTGALDPSAVVAGVRCLEAGEADYALYWQFANRGALYRDYDNAREQLGIRRNIGECDGSEGEGAYSINDEPSGRIVCGRTDGAYLAWTRDDALIGVLDFRSDGDLSRLYDWWKEQGYEFICDLACVANQLQS